jgi:hypothetical protein
MGRTDCTEPQCLYKGALYLYLTLLTQVYSCHDSVISDSGFRCTKGEYALLALGTYRLRLKLPTPVAMKYAVWNVTAPMFVDKWICFGVKYYYLFQDRISCNNSYTSFYELQIFDTSPQKNCMNGREDLKENNMKFNVYM